MYTNPGSSTLNPAEVFVGKVPVPNYDNDQDLDPASVRADLLEQSGIGFRSEDEGEDSSGQAPNEHSSFLREIPEYTEDQVAGTPEPKEPVQEPDVQEKDTGLEVFQQNYKALEVLQLTGDTYEDSRNFLDAAGKHYLMPRLEKGQVSPLQVIKGARDFADDSLKPIVRELARLNDKKGSTDEDLRKLEELVLKRNLLEKELSLMDAIIEKAEADKQSLKKEESGAFQNDEANPAIEEEPALVSSEVQVAQKISTEEEEKDHKAGLGGLDEARNVLNNADFHVDPIEPQFQASSEISEPPPENKSSEQENDLTATSFVTKEGPEKTEESSPETVPVPQTESIAEPALEDSMAPQPEILPDSAVKEDGKEEGIKWEEEPALALRSFSVDHAVRKEESLPEKKEERLSPEPAESQNSLMLQEAKLSAYGLSPHHTFRYVPEEGFKYVMEEGYKEAWSQLHHDSEDKTYKVILIITGPNGKVEEYVGSVSKN